MMKFLKHLHDETLNKPLSDKVHDDYFIRVEECMLPLKFDC